MCFIIIIFHYRFGSKNIMIHFPGREKCMHNFDWVSVVLVWVF